MLSEDSLRFWRISKLNEDIIGGVQVIFPLTSDMTLSAKRSRSVTGEILSSILSGIIPKSFKTSFRVGMNLGKLPKVDSSISIPSEVLSW